MVTDPLFVETFRWNVSDAPPARLYECNSSSPSEGGCKPIAKRYATHVDNACSVQLQCLNCGASGGCEADDQSEIFVPAKMAGPWLLPGMKQRSHPAINRIGGINLVVFVSVATRDDHARLSNRVSPPRLTGTMCSTENDCVAKSARLRQYSQHPPARSAISRNSDEVTFLLAMRGRLNAQVPASASLPEHCASEPDV